MLFRLCWSNTIYVYTIYNYTPNMTVNINPWIHLSCSEIYHAHCSHRAAFISFRILCSVRFLRSRCWRAGGSTPWRSATASSMLCTKWWAFFIFTQSCASGTCFAFWWFSGENTCIHVQRSSVTKVIYHKQYLWLVILKVGLYCSSGNVLMKYTGQICNM